MTLDDVINWPWHWVIAWAVTLWAAYQSGIRRGIAVAEPIIQSMKELALKAISAAEDRSHE